jgi:hypothetical protein
MSTWQMTVVFALAVGAVGCLLGIAKAIETLSTRLELISHVLAEINQALIQQSISDRANR